MGEEVVEDGAVAEDLHLVGVEASQEHQQDVRRRARTATSPVAWVRSISGAASVSRISHSPSRSVQCRCSVSLVPVGGCAPGR